ncbi:MAG: GNAT family N-acetyltransferase [Candidatus Eisenbacteria sp.]|nr:GNAT family N-acetyltransferase [Candidatus Eisenbacteria bacterium]
MISIRELRPEDDLAAVLTLCKDFLAEYEGHHREFFDTGNLSDADISGRFLQSMESDSSATIIALVDDAIVGYASLAVREQPRFYRIKKVGVISGLMVANDHRRKGIATRLLAAAEAYFQRKAIGYFTAYTAVANHAAIEFYEHNGMGALHTTFIGETGSTIG